MHINFAMWRKASWQLIKMDDNRPDPGCSIASLSGRGLTRVLTQL